MDSLNPHALDRRDMPLVGRSARWLQTLQLARKVAKLDVPVLVTGPSGSGKELVARSIHRWSRRQTGGYVPLNCGAPENLLEHELFGQRRSSIPGGPESCDGLCGEAENGTLFLDEVGDLPTACQAKLLRFIESGEYRPLGSAALRYSNARVIAATRCDLERKIAEGVFRRDLYYRLNVLRVDLPPLRERREDIPLLVNHFLGQRALGEARCRMTPAALTLLVSYCWPGNVRELKSVVERAAILSEQGVIGADLVESLLAVDRAAVSEHDKPRFDTLLPLDRVVDAYVSWALQYCRGNISTTARMLRISRSKIYRILERAPVGDPSCSSIASGSSRRLRVSP